MTAYSPVRRSLPRPKNFLIAIVKDLRATKCKKYM